jgi:outer membrane protein OmpA-like peptidoglycan-associated protein
MVRPLVRCFLLLFLAGGSPLAAQEFRVQIAAFADSVPSSYFRERGVESVLPSYDRMGLYRYFAGSFRTREDAESMVRKLVAAGFPHAAVIDLEEQRVLSEAHCPHVRHGQVIVNDPTKPRLESNIYFDSGVSDLSAEARAELDRVGLQLKENPELYLRILGHSDGKGDAKNNIEVAERRSRNTRNYLINKGIRADRMFLKVFGESDPVAPNQDDTGKDLPENRKWNRRVELVLTKEKSF